jgi:hypothetical protein
MRRESHFLSCSGQICVLHGLDVLISRRTGNVKQHFISPVTAIQALADQVVIVGHVCSVCQMWLHCFMLGAKMNP